MARSRTKATAPEETSRGMSNCYKTAMESHAAHAESWIGLGKALQDAPMPDVGEERIADAA